ncbi:MarR family winged helix-turn-helix transcriptional regulator [Euzebya tangerina]|uniref:MarR family winged helix-turn-helix transcriptional regulator n=1 Tax=Euzebya tangerina TaxID=591198 RepID=UPI000E315B13|nr:MarR family winged helix-turn-helix transcriptional regulator [Euzebya tangerina]
MRDLPLAAALLDAAEWFNTALLERLAERGWPRLSRNQSLVFPLLSAEGATSQTMVARSLGITRQSAHTLLLQLVELGVLRREPDPSDGRRSLMRLTADGRRLAKDARTILTELEEELARRIGESAVQDLAEALSAEWGPTPSPTPDRSR